MTKRSGNQRVRAWNSAVHAALAGLWGGGLAGALDALVTSQRLGDQISGLRHVQLLLLGAALGSVVGLAVAAAAWLLALGVGAGCRRVKRPALAAALWPPLLASPLVVSSALMMFSGPKASRIPGHFALSLLLAAAGLAGLGALGLWGARVHRQARAPETRRNALRWTLAAGFVALATLAWANGNVLPRLYPWFHQALAYAVLGLAVALVWLALGKAPRLRWAVAGVFLLVLLPGLMGYRTLRHSRQVRFALFDKTAALGVYASKLPLPRPQTIARPFATAAQDGAAPVALPEGPKRPGADVVVITIDALRHDHVGAYGAKLPVTPHLNRLAAEGVRFSRAYTQAPHTSFAVTSMLTGKYYPTLLRLKSGDPGEPLTLLLRRYGWKTAAFYPPAVFFVDGDKLATFRDNHFHFEYVKCEFLDAEGRVEQIQTYFETVKPERAFLWVHFFEPHEPYEAHEGYAFGNKDLDRYASEVAYTDAAVGKIMDYLARERPGAIVIVSADHGEEFDEHGGRYHGSSLYDEQVRVPFIVKLPDGPARVVGGQVQLADVAPTVLSLLDIPVPARMRATDLGPWLSQAGAPDAALPAAFAEVEGKRMVVHGEEKLICDAASGACQLFDLAEDPGERDNLIDEAPERAERLRQRLERWMDAQGRLETLEAETRGALPRAIERGRLGDPEAAADLLGLARSPGDEGLRTEAARLLAQLAPQPALRQELEVAIEGAAAFPAVARWLAVAAHAAGAEVEAHLLPVVEAPPGDAGVADEELALMAALVLAERGQAQGKERLQASLASCNGTAICRRTIRALSGLGDVAAVPVLHETMADVNARLEVVRALGVLRSPASLPVLARALKEDERVPVRAEAARALAEVGGAKARAALVQAARREREASVQAAIAEALKRPGRRP